MLQRNTFFEEFKNMNTALFSHSQFLNFFKLYRNTFNLHNRKHTISSLMRKNSTNTENLIEEIIEKLIQMGFISSGIEYANLLLLFKETVDLDIEYDVPVLIIHLTNSVSSIEIELDGDKIYIDKMIDWFNNEYDTKVITFSTITSIDDNGIPTINKDSISKTNLGLYRKEFYPYFDFDLKDYLDGFKKSKSNLIVLIGEPGTGKTSFLRNICQEFDKDITVINSSKVLEHNEAVPTFQRLDSNLLILEDADNITRKRELENDLMVTLLNGIDGLVNFHNKKFIISTNLPTIKDVDDALIRPGRCFDILYFNNLTKAQANEARKAIGKEELTFTETTLTLAHALNYDEVSNAKHLKKASIGFVGV